MKLIIYSNPNPKSFTYALKNAYAEYFSNKTENYKEIDLYSNPKYLKIGGYSKELKAKLQKLIKNSDELIFIHPLYWINMPAVMKNFFEEVFTEGFAYSYLGQNREFTPLIKDKKAKVIITGNGLKSEYQDFNGDTDFQIVWKDLLSAMGFSSPKVIYIGGMDRNSQKDLEIILQKIKDYGEI